MLTELNIKNFRLFKHLKIEGLKQVNLFAGKNNSGKTALLEAIRIYAAGNDLSVMRYILQQRGQPLSNYWDTFDSFFYRPELGTYQKKSGAALQFSINDKFHFERIYKGDRDVAYTLTSNGASHDASTLQNNLPQPLLPRDPLVFLPFSSSEHFPLQYFWDEIVLTPKEDEVVKILQETILPTLIRLDIKDARTLVRLSGDEKPIPLQNLGDGAQRMLSIAIALVSAKDNMLLIDEIEAGLHYSVTEKLWELIFKYANALNVQVFATTHSSDAIKTFIYVLEKPENKDKGAYFRLQTARKTGQIEAISYDLERLESALETKSEIR